MQELNNNSSIENIALENSVNNGDQNLDVNLTTNVEEVIWNFYKIRTTDNGNIIDFKIANILKFLENEGYRRLKMPNGGYELVKINKNSILIFSDNADMVETLKTKILNIDCQPEVWEEFLERNYLTSQMENAMERITEVKLNQSTKTHSYFFFKNGVVEATAENINLIPYEEFDGFLFQDQIIDYNFEVIDFVKCENGMFDKFLKNITNNEVTRYDFLTSSIGYLLNSYKDKALTKAVIFVDEEIDFAGGAEGGTGKTLVSDGISKVVNSVVKDGRSLANNSNRFFYQDIELGHRLMIIDDISTDTHFERFFSVVTGGMVVEKKGKQSFSIPFEISPKLLITTNYMVTGGGGYSEERRKIEVEIAPYYRGKSVKEDFGCTFFADWDQSEWNIFYNKMIGFCQKFLKFGIMETEPINLIENKLISETDFSFVEFMDSNIVLDEKTKIFREEKCQYFDAFKTKHPLETKNLTINMFKKWCNKYAAIRNYEIDHEKNNSKSFLKIYKKETIENQTPLASPVID